MRPRLSLQLAHSADGFIARPGERTHLSCEQSWAKVYAARQNFDAIMIGANTALTDNPKLTSHAAKTPVRVVVDSHARLPVSSHLAQTARDIPVWLLTLAASPELETMGVRLIACKGKDGRVDMHDALEKLGALNIKTLICEGGAALAQTLNDERLVDELILMESPVLLGAGVALPVLSGYRPVHEEKTGTDTWRYYERA